MTPKGITLSPKYAPILSGQGGRIATLACPTRYLIVTGGRGSGKSYAISLALSIAIRSEGYAVLFTRWTMASAKDSIIPEFLEKLNLLGIAGEYDVTLADIRHKKSGSIIMFRGIKTSAGNQTAKLKSLHGLNVWVLDEAEEMPDEGTFDKIDESIRDSRRPNLIVLALNPAHKRHWIYRRWYDRQGIPDGFCGEKDGVTYIHTDYEDNSDNLPVSYLAKIERDKRGNPIRFDQIWRGAWADEVQGALWSWGMISDYRIDPCDLPSDLVRVVVGIDPNATSGPNADEAGVIVAAQGRDGHFYILADYSAIIGPAEWAKVVCRAWETHRADHVVAEKNNGGEMVAITIHSVSRLVPVHLVNASRGKTTRAEPIAALYSQGKVHHVGRFPELESEMMSYTGEGNEASPNRMDACFVAGTLITTARGLVPIESVSTDDFVLTRRGFFPVSFAGLTRRSTKVLTLMLSSGITLTCSLDHRIWIQQKGWVKACNIKSGQQAQADESSMLCLMESSTSGSTPEARQTEDTSGLSQEESSQWESSFMSPFGSRFMGLFRLIASFIIPMETRRIIQSKISGVFLESNTLGFIAETARSWSGKWNTRDCSRQSGTEARRESTFISDSERKHGSSARSRSRRYAHRAASLSLHSSRPNPDIHRFAQDCAATDGTTRRKDTSLTGSALRAGACSRSDHTGSNRHAPVSVVRKSGAGRQDVYNLHVAGPHEYYANGILVHNCVWALADLSGIEQGALTDDELLRKAVV